MEFFKLAGVMLGLRYQLINGSSCFHDPTHLSKQEQEPLYTQMTYLGYKDTVTEMMLLLNELKRSSSFLEKKTSAAIHD